MERGKRGYVVCLCVRHVVSLRARWNSVRTFLRQCHQKPQPFPGQNRAVESAES